MIENKTPEQKAEIYAKKWWGHIDIKPIQLSYRAGYEQCSNDKQLELDELKKQVEEKSLECTGWYRMWEMKKNQLAAKEKEIEEFAEWCDINYYSWLVISKRWICVKGPEQYTTTELLKQFRDENKQFNKKD